MSKSRGNWNAELLWILACFDSFECWEFAVLLKAERNFFSCRILVTLVDLSWISWQDQTKRKKRESSVQETYSRLCEPLICKENHVGPLVPDSIRPFTDFIPFLSPKVFLNGVMLWQSTPLSWILEKLQKYWPFASGMISLCKLKHKNEKETERHRAVDPKVEWWFHGSIPTKNKQIFEFRAIYIHIPICLMILGLVPSPSPPPFFSIKAPTANSTLQPLHDRATGRQQPSASNTNVDCPVWTIGPQLQGVSKSKSM